MVWVVIAAWSSVVVGAEPSAADRAAAIALFKEARGLMTAGSYEQACAKFTESLRLAPGIGTRFNLAECQAKTGKLASAWANYLEVAAVTGQAGQTKRERAARRQAAALQPKLSTLRIDVREPVDGLRITRNDQPVPSAQWNAALPVDPGKFRIHAEAPAHWPHNYTAVVDGQGQTVRVVVQPLESKVASFDGGRDHGTGTSSGDITEAQKGAHGRATGGWIVGGIGLVQVVAGAVLFGVGESWIVEAEENCPDRMCSGLAPGDADYYTNLGNDGRTLRLVGVGSIVPGAGAVVAGIVLVATGQADLNTPTDQARSPFWVAPQIGPNGTSLSIGTAW